ncbi:hypothetical protein [Aeromonas sp. R4-3]|uniref:hypothetical protein n=1 Tax=Aeromonas sp. R4-3 TaxID=3138466 RepID=UPI0034A584FE
MSLPFKLPLAACRVPLAACRLPLAACRLPLAASWPWVVIGIFTIWFQYLEWFLTFKHFTARLTSEAREMFVFQPYITGSFAINNLFSSAVLLSENME